MSNTKLKDKIDFHGTQLNESINKSSIKLNDNGIQFEQNKSDSDNKLAHVELCNLSNKIEKKNLMENANVEVGIINALTNNDNTSVSEISLFNTTTIKNSASKTTNNTELKIPLLLSGNEISNNIIDSVTIPHVSSEPLLVAQLHRSEQQQLKIKSYQNAKQTAIWQLESTDPKIILNTDSVTASPSMLQKNSEATMNLPRRVSFPKSDSELVTGYLEPANPWKHVPLVKSISEISELYVTSCHKHKTLPLQIVLDHLKVIELNKELRQPLLSLHGIKLNPGDCESLEEIFKRVQYKSIDLSACELDEIAASALFEMIEYYEATQELNISSNSKGMTHRGWVSCSYMISHSQSLHTLNAQSNPLSKSSAENLGHALSTSNLHTLKLEHCGLKGAPLNGLCFKLRHNKTLRELWLANNDLDCYDADAIGELLKVNHFLELVDISNNNIRNEGLEYIIKALIVQSHELQRRSMLHRSAAIDNDESLSPAEISNTVESISSYAKTDNNFPFSENEDQILENKQNHILSKDELKQENVTQDTSFEIFDVPTEKDKSSKLFLNAIHQSTGQSMLDKLLSMNNESHHLEKTTDALNSERVSFDASKISRNRDAVNRFHDILESSEDVENIDKKSDLVNHCAEEEYNLHTSNEMGITVDGSIYKENSTDIEKKYETIKSSKGGDDYDDAHSTDSAFESASEGDISRHLAEEYNRYTSSIESSQIQEAIKDLNIEKVNNTSESSVSVVESDAIGCCPTNKNPLLLIDSTTDKQYSNLNIVLIPKVTIAEESFIDKNEKTSSSQAPTPPPPGTSPGKVSIGIHRTESSCSFLTQAARNRSQSSDSLCSDTSLDGSLSSELNFSTSAQLNEKITKNDTLTRQTRNPEIAAETSNRAPGGLKALAVWNNNLTKESASFVTNLLTETVSLELLNIGKNCLSNEFVHNLKDGLKRNSTLTTLGLQSAHLSEKGIEELSSVLSFGGNSTLQRIDIRDNKLEVGSLSAIVDALKSNTFVTQIDIDDVPKRLSVGSKAHLEYIRYVEMVRSMCSRNEKSHPQLQTEKSPIAGTTKKNRSGFYLGSRKISLTMASRPLLESPICGVMNATNCKSKLDVKRRHGTRLRSPVPSPPTISPSSSPNRSRFQVFRVTEVSPLTSPITQSPPQHTMSPQINNINFDEFNVSTMSSSLDNQQVLNTTNAHSSFNLPTSSSLPSMATITSSTQSVKRLAISPRSRFHVSKIYEDPHVPLANRSLPPITPPINSTPPITKISPDGIVAVSQSVPEVVVDHIATLRNDNITKTEREYDVHLDSKNSILYPADSFVSINQFPSSISSSPLSSTSPPSKLSHCSSFLGRISTETSPDQTDLSASLECSENSVTSETFSSENDATLTQSSIIRDALTNSITTQNVDLNEEGAIDCCKTTTLDNLTVNPVPTPQQRSRKVSWIANPAAVDKLLTLFQNPSTIFQRSCSPEPKTNLSSMSMNQEFSNNNITSPAILESQNSSLISTNKWTKSGVNDISSAAVGSVSNVNAENSRSFLGAATKQFRDLSKQVFSFGQEFDINAQNFKETSSNDSNGSLTLDNTVCSTNDNSENILTTNENNSTNKLLKVTKTMITPQNEDTYLIDKCEDG